MTTDELKRDVLRVFSGAGYGKVWFEDEYHVYRDCPMSHEIRIGYGKTEHAAWQMAYDSLVEFGLGEVGDEG